MTQQLGQTTQQPQMSPQTSMQQPGTLPQEYRTTLDAVAQAVEVCGWCADQCIKSGDPNMIECIRLCEDVVELGESVLATVPRSSRYMTQILQTFEQAAQECAQECSRHQDAHCQECAAVLPQVVSATQQLSRQGQQMSGQGMGGQQIRQSGNTQQGW